jgi:glycosyltransferase involved in cell wall biosynthesis
MVERGVTGRAGVKLRSATRPLRIALYEPAGRGGVCHYTHQLGEHLSLAGVQVSVITAEDYELEHFQRHFTVEHLFGRSWVTRIREQFRASRSKTGEPQRIDRCGDRPEEGSPPPIREPVPSSRRLLRDLRRQFLHLRLFVRFLFRRPDIVHFQWLVSRSADSRFLRLLRWVGIPAVYTAHDIEPHMLVSEEDRADLQRIYRSVARIIVHAESNKRELVSLFDVEPAKISVIPHGSYDFLCAREPLTKGAARQRIGLPAGKRVILFFGLIKRYKGLEYLVDAFPRVREAIPNAFLLVVGDVYGGDSEGDRFYRSLIEKLQDRDDVLCVPHYVPTEAVGAYLAAADVVVLPYTRTFQSGVLLAACAAARPVVVTDTGGLSEVVENGKSGLVVPPRDSGALAAAVIEILTDPERLDAMGEYAGRLAASAYSWKTIASRTIELYRSVARRPSETLAGGANRTDSIPGIQSDIDGGHPALGASERKGWRRLG